MSLFEYFQRISPPEERKVEAQPQAEAVAEGDTSSEEEPEANVARPVKRAEKPRKSYTNLEKATVVKWCTENRKTAADAAREFNYKPRLVQSK